MPPHAPKVKRWGNETFPHEARKEMGVAKHHPLSAEPKGVPETGHPMPSEGHNGTLPPPYHAIEYRSEGKGPRHGRGNQARVHGNAYPG